MAEFKFIGSRFFVCTGLREILQTGVSVDLARGLPIIHVNFPGYDEKARRRGPASKFALAELKRIDRVIRHLHAIAHLCDARDYQVWVVSLSGWHPEMERLSFPPEQGAHAGPGTEETSGFALVPGNTRFPEHAAECLRPSVLREAVLHALGRKLIPNKRTIRPATTRTLRVLTYNVHSCVGLDGRLSPGRIARIIRGFDPDIVALQEIDVNRARSRGEDQATRLARELEMEVSFCCTVNRATEKYGHALLTRFPVEVIASGVFGDAEDHREPRGVLVAKLDLSGQKIYVANTHFGLTAPERLKQMETFLGDEWLGWVPADAPLVVCGDFNMLPGSSAYDLMISRLADAQTLVKDHKPRRTFPSPLPISRIDFVFISKHFDVEKVRVPKNSQTRVASDHLPVGVDLKIKG